ncbi:MAG TPA: potassium transporter Kup [Gemmatimonadaceae bacterium]|nr:potassium transporter Kup [Gemmatimonadaceae bacterium]
MPAEPPRSGEPAAAAPANGTSGFHTAVPRERLHVESHPTGKRLAFLSLAALGVVYGDIGTSPLYALKECFRAEYGISPTQQNVYGVLSLLVWTLILVVCVKYLVFIMRADNRGEGGILALLALLLQDGGSPKHTTRRKWLVVLGIFGAALLYGDGMITPAISVLGAMEGLQIAAPHIGEFTVVVSTVIILFALFSLQKHGTSRVGGLFGPIMAVWFVAIAALGVAEILRAPAILLAFNPWWGVRFFVEHGEAGFFILGAVVLVVTGAEALYADMGHFGKRPIRLAWFAFVFPALLFNYFGQGAILLRDPSAVANPFFLLAPRVLLYPLVGIATLAAIVASQALISGAFSLMQQSVQLGYSPRVTIIHTSSREAGQIYIPEVNDVLRIGTIVLVLSFRSVANLSAAYGIAVTGTMVITSLLFYSVARTRWEWSILKAGSLTLGFLIVDVALMAANLVKIEYGGWVPIAIAVAIFALMSSWKRGRIMLNRILHSGALPLDLFLDDVARRKPTRVPGTAVFMTSSPKGVPVVLLHHVKHNKVLHDQVVLMSILTLEVPEVDDHERITLEKFEEGFWRLTARYGFMETPDVPEVLNRARALGLRAKVLDTTFYLGRERIIVLGKGEKRTGRGATPDAEDGPVLEMARWRKKLFVVMSRNARSATEFFNIPPNRVVELGAQVEF